jgi:SAM-dependent methyltransferase
MKICPTCHAPLAGSHWTCAQCGWTATRTLGIPRLSATSPTDQDAFDPAQFEALFELEAANFWFRSRNKLILWSMDKYFPETRNMMELGCGTGFVLRAIENARPALNLTGSELFAQGAALAARRVENATVVQMDARNIPFRDEFDLVGAFDVIEHVDDDAKVLFEIHKSLRDNGGLLLTVPQHPALWSSIDEFARHQRRYTRTGLRSKLEYAGFRILRCTSFVSILFPAMLISRLAQRSRPIDPLAEFRIPPLLNRLFENALDIERWIIGKGLSFPFGGSLLVVAKR